MAEAKAVNTINIPLSELSLSRLEQISPELLTQDPLYVICRSGQRSMMACQILANEGFAGQLINVDGGTLAWVEEGLPLG
ncbi:MAG: rhodanese-like domain-containing protein [Pseudobacteriovorax sp.]|nr:rhodanese-like domain-containing protein [Pseudobacteriovorax sp.]